MKYKYVILILLLWRSAFLSGQAVPHGTEVQELVKIAMVYEKIDNMSFNLRYTFADSLTWQDLTDSMHASCKVSHGRSLVSNTDFEFLKGNEYDVLVDKEDSVVMVMRRRAEESIFKAPLLDSMFRAVHVDSMWIFSINDSNWIFRATFKPESFYSYYEMRYDPRTGLIRYLTYHGLNYTGAYDIPSDHVVCAFIHMSNYSFAVLDPTLFNEHRYFYKLNGNLYLQPAWDDYELETY